MSKKMTAQEAIDNLVNRIEMLEQGFMNMSAAVMRQDGQMKKFGKILQDLSSITTDYLKAKKKLEKEKKKK